VNGQLRERRQRPVITDDDRQAVERDCSMATHRARPSLYISTPLGVKIAPPGPSSVPGPLGRRWIDG